MLDQPGERTVEYPLHPNGARDRSLAEREPVEPDPANTGGGIWMMAFEPASALLIYLKELYQNEPPPV